VAELAKFDGQLSSFGEDENGELYVVDMSGGVVLGIAAQPR
jgi:hypothetical protein